MFPDHKLDHFVRLCEPVFNMQQSPLYDTLTFYFMCFSMSNINIQDFPGLMKLPVGTGKCIFPCQKINSLG